MTSSFQPTCCSLSNSCVLHTKLDSSSWFYSMPDKQTQTGSVYQPRNMLTLETLETHFIQKFLVNFTKKGKKFRSIDTCTQLLFCCIIIIFYLFQYHWDTIFIFSIFYFNLNVLVFLLKLCNLCFCHFYFFILV